MTVFVKGVEFMEKWRQKIRDILYQNREEIDDRVQNGTNCIVRDI